MGNELSSIDKEVISIAQLVLSSIISAGIIGLFALIFSSRKKSQREYTLLNIKLDAMYYGMSNINSQFATIGNDFKEGYNAKKKELMDEHKFKENEQ